MFVVKDKCVWKKKKGMIKARNLFSNEFCHSMGFIKLSWKKADINDFTISVSNKRSDMGTLDHILMLTCFWGGSWRLSHFSSVCNEKHKISAPVTVVKKMASVTFPGCCTPEYKRSWPHLLTVKKKLKTVKENHVSFKRRNDGINRNIVLSGRTNVLNRSHSAFDHWERLTLVALLQMKIILRMGKMLCLECVGPFSFSPPHFSPLFSPSLFFFWKVNIKFIHILQYLCFIPNSLQSGTCSQYNFVWLAISSL